MDADWSTKAVGHVSPSMTDIGKSCTGGKVGLGLTLRRQYISNQGGGVGGGG